MASDWTGTYTWSVENFTKPDESELYSPKFEIGGYTWRLILYPRGNKYWGSADHIAVYLEFTEAAFTPQRMCPKAKFELIAVKSNSLEESLRREATQTFSAQAADWGYTQFISIQYAQNPQNGYQVNDAFTLRVNLYLEEIDGILGMKSKAETGFVGIKSFREASLLSAFLQCLFHIKAFRKAVFEMPIMESDKSPKSLPSALQHLFSKLKNWNAGVEMKGIVNALDWNFTNARLQHDIFEIQRLFFRELCKENIAQSVKDCISSLFTGERLCYNKSPTSPEAQMHKQSYAEISLDVLECRDIYASLEKFCQIEGLDKGSLYQMTRSGRGQSEHYVLFDNFPTVIFFHLKHCYINSDLNAFLKVNSHYEFYDELDLDNNDRVQLSSNADKTVENKYRLHSMLVHADGPKGGRYFAYIRCQEKWYKSDDEVVTGVSAEEAINAQFGDQNGEASANFSKTFESINKSAAVMLVYIRKSEWSTVMCDNGVENISAQVRKRFDEETMKREQQKMMDAHLYINIKLATGVHLKKKVGKGHYFDLADLDTVNKYRIYKKTLFEDFKEMVCKDFGIPKHLQQFWLWNAQTNRVMQVSKPLVKKEQDLKTILDLRYFRDKTPPLELEENALMTIKLFLESPEEASLNKSNLHLIQRSKIMIFLKYYDPKSKALSYLGHIFVERTCQFYAILEKAKKMAGLAPEEDVIGFEEVKHSPTVICNELIPDSTPGKTLLFRGDIIIIQKVAVNSQCEFPTVTSFLEFIQNSTHVNFRPLKNPKDKGFKLDLLKTLTYEQVTNELAKHLGIKDPKRLRLTRHNIYTCTPLMSPIKYNEVESLEEMILDGRQYSSILYYEVIDVQLPHEEILKCLKVQFHNLKGEWQSEHQLRLPKDYRVSDLAQALKVELGEEYSNNNIRIMETLSSKVFTVLDPKGVLEELYEAYWTFRAEVIPEDQKNLKSDEYLVLFCHCKPRNNGKTVFGYPLWVKIERGEIVRDVRVRIQKTLEISDEEFNHWRFAYHGNPMLPLDYLKNEDEILARFSRTAVSARTNGKFVGDNNSFIAMVHQDASPDHQTLHWKRTSVFSKCLSYISNLHQ